MDRVAVVVSVSEGEDGYTEGTWSVTVTLGRYSTSDGGYSSREAAERAGRRLVKAANQTWLDA